MRVTRPGLPHEAAPGLRFPREIWARDLHAKMEVLVSWRVACARVFEVMPGI
jgi:hypothetical protein